jgi:streptomycin 6-kinase
MAPGMAIDIQPNMVVKTSHPTSALREFTALTRLGPGMVEVLKHGDGVLYLERINPGRSLDSSIDSDDVVHETIGHLIVEMQSHQLQHRDQCEPTSVDLPKLAQVLVPLQEVNDERLPAYLVRRALALGRELTAGPAARHLVVHGDLHAGNILWDAGRDRWRIIDPHGWVGDPVFEAVVALCAPQGLGIDGDARGSDPAPLVARLNRRVSILCDVTGFDRYRLEAWAFVGAVIAEARMLAQHDLVHGAPLALAEGLHDQGIGDQGIGDQGIG